MPTCSIKANRKGDGWHFSQVSRVTSARLARMRPGERCRTSGCRCTATDVTLDFKGSCRLKKPDAGSGKVLPQAQC